MSAPMRPPQESALAILLFAIVFMLGLTLGITLGRLAG